VDWGDIGSSVPAASGETSAPPPVTPPPTTTVTAAEQQTQAQEISPSEATFVDSRDGKTYKKVTIGAQTWMAQNLDYDVPNVATDACYGNNADNCAKYGRLYDWPTAKAACPAGWRLPNDAEWGALIGYAGGEGVAGGKLKAVSGWNNDGNGTDEYGFSALSGGNGSSGVNYFIGVGNESKWWSASEYEGQNPFGGGGKQAYYRGMDYSERTISNIGEDRELLSVRCLQN